jgi:hypothetical protein
MHLFIGVPSHDVHRSNLMSIAPQTRGVSYAG